MVIRLNTTTSYSTGIRFINDVEHVVLEDGTVYPIQQIHDLLMGLKKYYPKAPEWIDKVIDDLRRYDGTRSLLVCTANNLSPFGLQTSKKEDGVVSEIEDIPNKNYKTFVEVSTTLLGMVILKHTGEKNKICAIVTNLPEIATKGDRVTVAAHLINDAIDVLDTWRFKNITISVPEEEHDVMGKLLPLYGFELHVSLKNEYRPYKYEHHYIRRTILR